MIRFLDFAEELFEVPQDFKLPEALKTDVLRWETLIWQQIECSKFGYPQTDVYETPVLEDTVISLLLPLLGAERLRKKSPTLCLSHDLDYLNSTIQMNLKRSVATRRPHFKNETYLNSIKEIIAFDLNTANSSVFFVATPQKASTPTHRMKQWLLDPSYELQDELFQQALEHLKHPQVEIGIHGSFYSHELNLLSDEVRRLHLLTDKKITSGRQHWLNLPEPKKDFERMRKAGITVDSTLGWNGAIGFRGGIARCLPVSTSHGRLYLLPMVLMDGPLFDDLKMTTTEVVETSKRLLSQVLQRGGTVSIDWHERSAHPSYDWFKAYQQIVTWAKAQGFHFSTPHNLKNGALECLT